jgi:hypothetical protein
MMQINQSSVELDADGEAPRNSAERRVPADRMHAFPAEQLDGAGRVV